MRYLFGVLLLINLTAYAQPFNTSLIPANLLTRANATIRNEEVSVDMQAPNKVVIIKKKTITIFNKNADEYARIIEYYDKSTVVKSANGEVFNANGKLIGKFTLANFKDESAASNSSLFESIRVKHFLPNIQTYPYTVSYTIELRLNQNLVIRDWMPNYYSDISVEKSSYQFISKKDEKLNIKTQHFNGTSDEIIIDKDRKMLSWEVSNIPAIKIESMMPIRSKMVTMVKIAPENFIYFNKKGSYKNWDELGLWTYNELLKSKRELSAETKNILKKLLEGVTDPKEKARKLYAYMQNKTRYVSIQIGIGGIEPFPAEDVDRLSYGDCKALVNYMQSLLDYAEIPSYYCVVQAGSTKIDLDPDFASMAQGNHVILAIPFEDEMIWLECTDQKIPFGFLSDFTDDRNVLAISASGGKIIRTPKLSTEMNTQNRNGVFNISAEGDIKGDLTTIFSGGQYDNHARLSSPLSDIDTERTLKTYYNINNIDFLNVKYTQDKSINPNAKEELSIQIPGYISKNMKRLIFQPNIFNIQPIAPENQNRQFPVYINRGFTDEDELRFLIPDNISYTLPKEVNIDNEFGSYHYSLTKEGNNILLKRKLIVHDGTFPPALYETYYKFINTIRNTDLTRISMEISD